MRKKSFHKTLTRWYKAQCQAFVENGFWLSTGQGEPCPLQIQNYLKSNEMFLGKYIFEIDYIISIHQYWLAIMKIGKNFQHQKHLRNLSLKSGELAFRQQNIFSSCLKQDHMRMNVAPDNHLWSTDHRSLSSKGQKNPHHPPLFLANRK